MIKKFKPAEEWLKQAEYDFETAQAMFSSGRYIYTIFMSHLSIEKGLKAIYSDCYSDNPPKTHNLLYLLTKIQDKKIFDVNEKHFETLKELNTISAPVRYPENLFDLMKDFNKEKTQEILLKTEGLLKWLKENIKG